MGLILFSTHPRKKHLRDGYLFCPKCRRRTTGELYLMEDSFYLLGLIPTGSVGESRNFLGCRECGETFEESGDWAFDFGDHPEPKRWDIRRCGAWNTSEQLHGQGGGRHI